MSNVLVPRPPQALHSALGGLTPPNRRIVLELAQRLLALQELQGLRPVHAPPPDLRPFLEDFHAYLVLQGKAPATRRHHTFYARQLLAYYPNPTTAQVDSFLTTKLDAGLAPASIRNVVFACKSFFAFLAHRGIIADNPAEHLSLPRLPRRERLAPPAADVARLLHSPIATLRDRAVLHLFVDCGLRLAELQFARPTDIDLASSQITVIGKGNKQRTVPFSPDTHFALREYIACLPAGGRWLLPGRPPSKPLHYRYIEQRLDALCVAAGISRVTPHQLRHFFATSMLNDGANLKVVSNLLGHAHASTTLDVYWHVLDADQKRSEHRLHCPLHALSKETP